MAHDPAFASLLRRTVIALIVCVALVTLSYFYVDRAVAFYVHDHGINTYPVLKWMTYPPPIVQEWVPAVLVLLAVRRAWGPLRRWEKALAVAGISVVLADQFRESMAYLFGRYWPETWIDNNPSLIQNDAYGFHPFHSGRQYGSFPSGHTARTVAAAAVFWIAYPKWRFMCILASLAVVVGLIGMNYHFVGDVIAGGFIGGIVGMYGAHICGLSPVHDPRSPRSSQP